LRELGGGGALEIDRGGHTEETVLEEDYVGVYLIKNRIQTSQQIARPTRQRQNIGAAQLVQLDFVNYRDDFLAIIVADYVLIFTVPGGTIAFKITGLPCKILKVLGSAGEKSVGSSRSTSFLSVDLTVTPGGTTFWRSSMLIDDLSIPLTLTAKATSKVNGDSFMFKELA